MTTSIVKTTRLTTSIPQKSNNKHIPTKLIKTTTTHTQTRKSKAPERQGTSKRQEMPGESLFGIQDC